MSPVGRGRMCCVIPLARGRTRAGAGWVRDVGLGAGGAQGAGSVSAVVFRGILGRAGCVQGS